MRDNKFFTYTEEQSIGMLEINRPDKLNALSKEVLEEFDILLNSLGSKKIKGLIFSGTGEKAFIAGADIESMTHMSGAQAKAFSDLGQRVTLKIEGLPFPVIAAVNGFALGGGLEMALACDFIYTVEKAKFALPEASLGLAPGFGGTQRLARLIGKNKAKELIYSGQMITAHEALACNLVLKIYKDKSDLLIGCKNYLAKCSSNSPLAISMVKKVINKGIDKNIEEGLLIEQSVFGELFSSNDMKEGTSAFLEKRKANFTGE